MMTDHCSFAATFMVATDAHPEVFTHVRLAITDLILAKLVMFMTAGATGAGLAFDAGRADFSVRVNDEVIPYKVFAIYALPGEVLDITAVGPENVHYHADAQFGTRENGRNRWRMTAPSTPGVYTIIIDGGNDSIRLNGFVMHPAASVSDGQINGYRIGSYPSRPLKGNPVYLPPDGFVELNEETASIQLSPHFRLSQFFSKQAGDYPKYLVLRERLLLKLELLLETVNAHGVRATSFTVMSGYRTPFYNAAIGNVEYSRHVYGGAADIYVDNDPEDDVMDDLNRDGKHDVRDAQTLYGWANRLFSEDGNRSLAGGLGVYQSTSAHGPFLHIDARGRRARWGLIP